MMGETGLVSVEGWRGVVALCGGWGWRNGGGRDGDADGGCDTRLR